MLRERFHYILDWLNYLLRYRFTAISDTMIVWEAAENSKMNDKIRTLYDQLVKDDAYRSFYFVWAMDNPEDYFSLMKNHHTMLVRKNTSDYYRTYAQARFWIHDCDLEKFIRPGKNQIDIRYRGDSQEDREIFDYLSAREHTPSLLEKFVRYSKKMLNRAHLILLIIKYNILGFFRTHGLFHNNNSLRLAKLKNCHQGKRCFLIGNGPSLTGADLDLLQDEYTFGTNMVYKIFDQTEWRPSYHCISDSIYASKLGQELSKKVKAPLFTTERTYRRMRNKPFDTTYVHTLQSERYKVRGNIQAYCMVKATVLSLAAEMAFHMGFKEIYLLGVDCTNPHAKGGHFTDNYTTKEVAETDIHRIKTRMKASTLTTDQIGAHIIDRSMEVYHLLDEYATKHGIHIYNATRGGNLEIFPRVKLEEVLGIEEEEK